MPSPSLVRRTAGVALAALAVLVAAAAQLPTTAAQSSCDTWDNKCAATLCDAAHVPSISGDIAIDRFGNQYFTVDAPDSSDLTITLTVFFGDPDVYASIGTAEVNRGNAQYRSETASERDIIRIPSSRLKAANCPGGTCKVQILVHGFTAALYRMVISDHTCIVELADGVPERQTVAIGEYAYFKFSVSAADTANALYIVVTPLSGDPDVLVAKCQGCGHDLRPTVDDPDSYFKREQQWGGDSLTIDESHHTVDTTYYIAVYGYHNATTFTVMAQLDAVVTLADGQPQEGSLTSHASHYYHLHTVGDPTKAITVSVTPQFGDVDLYITSQATGAPANEPSAANHLWASSSNWYSPEQVQIMPTDNGFLTTGGTYNIAVFANTDTAYSIVAHSEGALVTLRDGIPQQASVLPGHYAYFQFHVDDATENVAIDVTAISGDPDLFVSCEHNLSGDDSGTPSRLNNTWASVAWGQDTISIEHTDIHSCSGRNDGSEPGAAVGGTFYIGVYGYTNATFSILASMDTGRPTTLVDGQPQDGNVVHATYKMYEIYVGAADTRQELTITITPVYGDPDLYVTTNGRQARRDEFQYQSQTSRGNDYVFIPADEMCHDCYVSIAVYGFSSAAYTITATTSLALRTLQDGVAVRDYVEDGEYAYFRFDVENPGTLEITVTKIVGDPDLLVSQSVEKPTFTTPDTDRATHFGDDTLTYENALGTYYIGVRGYTNTTFTLLAHVQGGDGEMMHRLVIGQPQTGTVSHNTWRYYQLVVGATKPRALTFVVTPVAGAVNLYVNPCSQSFDQCSGGRGDGEVNQRPHPDDQGHINAVWTSTHALDKESVRILASDHNSCAECSYIVGVEGVSASDAEFSITATNTEDVVLLQDGVPFRDYVDQGQFEYFTFTLVQAHNDVVISVTPFTGDPDVYVTACGTTFSDGEANQHNACIDRPNNVTNTWRHVNFGADTIAIPYMADGSCEPDTNDPCQYYVAVHGYQASSFTIMAYTHSDLPVQLVDGVPQSGAVNISMTNTYVLYADPGTSDVEITLTPTTGDADLYVTTASGPVPERGDPKPSPQHFDYSSMAAFGEDHVHISSHDADTRYHCVADQTCRIHISVVGFMTSQYTLVATSSHGVTSLQAGVPMRDTVPGDLYEYFTFTADVPDSVVDISITPISGDPDMFVATGEVSTRPTDDPATYTWRSTRLGADVVEIHPEDAHACTIPCNYYIGVKGYNTDSEFSILASQRDASPVTLVEGVPQEGFVNDTWVNQYLFTVDAASEGIEITVTPRFGDPDLYVTLDGSLPSATNYAYRSMFGSGADSVLIDSSDDAWRASPCHSQPLCRVRIGVHGFRASSYSVTARIATTQTVLQDGLALQDSVSDDHYKYYVYRNDNFNSAVSITLTPISGDPDMYISTRPHPSSATGAHEWAANRLGLDVIDIYPDDPNACTPPCQYYISVYGYESSASFTLLAANHSGLPVQLIDGVPQMGRVGEGRLQRYMFDATPDVNSVTISISPLYGDPDMFVALDDTPPSRAHFQYVSMSSEGDDVITINNNDAPFLALCAPTHAAGANCRVHIAVYGYQAAEYTISADTADSITHLVEGVPYLDTVPADQYTYFTFQVLRPDAAVTFTVAPLSGDPDMYVSTSETHPQALEGHYSWASTSVNDDEVTIEPNDARSTCTGVPCTYYIGVRGFSVASSFVLTATVEHDTRVDTLLAGTPIRAHAAPFAFTYFKFRMTPDAQNDHVEFTSTDFSGTTDMYVAKVEAGAPADHYPRWVCPPGVADPMDTSCHAEQFHWTSTTSFSRNRVSVPNTDPNWCASSTECVYVIGVMAPMAANTPGADFSLVAANADTITTLQDGVPQEGAVDQHMYETYRVLVSEGGTDLQITLTPFLGDPDLYASETVSHPKREAGQHSWQSLSFDQESLVVQWGQLEQCEDALGAGGQCAVFVSVYGFTQASYSIVTSLDRSSTRPVVLIDGVPQQAFVNNTQYAYFMAHVLIPEGTPMTIAVTPTFGDPDLYISREGEPGQTNFLWSSIHFGGEDRVTIQPDDANYCSSCVLQIGVYGYQASQFSITFSTGDTITRLQDGVPQQGVVGQDQYVYFDFGVESPDADVTFSVTPISGDPDMFIVVERNDEPLAEGNAPTMWFNTWHGNRFGDDLIVISHTDANFCYHCNYLVAVYGASSSTFTITATANNDRIITLVDGSPTTSEVAAGQYRYYRIRVVGTASSVTFRATATTGSVEMYITNTYADSDPPTGALPTRANNVWSSLTAATGSRNSITVDTSDAHWSRDHLVFTVGVYSDVQSLFTLVATTSETIQTLQAGVASTQHQIARGMTQHYVFNHDRADADVYFRLTALSGDPDLLVSTTQPRPYCAIPEGSPSALMHCHNYTWISQSSNGLDLLNISHSYPCANAPANTHCNAATDWTVPGRFYIGVFAYNDAHYSILAGYVGDHATLHDGQYQVATTSQLELCQERDPGTGRCESGSAHETKQGALFQFTTGGDMNHEDSDIVIEVDVLNAACPNGGQGGGGDCMADSLQYYVYGCNTQACGQDDRYPFSWRQQFSSDTAGVLFIPREHSDFCSSKDAVCHYYVGVYSTCEDSAFNPCPSLDFRIKYATSHGVDLIPHQCLDHKLCPQPTSRLDPGQSQDYEVYVGDEQTSLRIRLDACEGAPTFFMCHDQCAEPFYPSVLNHQYEGSTAETGYSELVLQTVDQTFYMAVVRSSNGVAADPWSYTLTVSTGDVHLLVPGEAPVASGATDHSVTLTWTLPTERGAVGNEPFPLRAGVTYEVYRAAGGFPEGTVVTTPCGLESFTASHAEETGVWFVTHVAAGVSTVEIADLESSTSYDFVVLARCAGECAADGADAMAVVYPKVSAVTQEASMSTGALVALVLLGIGVPVLAFVCWRYQRSKRAGRRLQYDMMDTDDMDGLDAVVSQPASDYRPLYTDASGSGTVDYAQRPLADRVREYMG